MSSNYRAKMNPNTTFKLTPTRPQMNQVESLHYFVKTSGGQVEPDKKYDEKDIIVYDPYEAQREDEVKFEHCDAWRSVMNIEQVTTSGCNTTHWNSTLDVANNNINSSNNNNEITNNYNNNNIINNNTEISALQVKHPGNNFVEGVIREDRDMFQCLHLLVDTAVAVASNVANNNINSSNNKNEITNNYNNNNNLINNNTATSALQVNHPGNHFVEGVKHEDRDMFQCLHLLVDTAVAVRQREKEQQEKEKRNDENVLVLGN